MHVVVTNGQRSPQKWAEMATAKIIMIADATTPEPLAAQAHAFADRIQQVIANYIDMALAEERALLVVKNGG